MHSLYLVLIIAFATLVFANEQAPRRRVSANPDEVLRQQSPDINVDQNFVLMSDRDESAFVKVTDASVVDNDNFIQD